MEEFNIGLYLLLWGVAGGAVVTLVMSIVWVSYPKSIGGLGQWVGAGVLLGTSSVMFSGQVALPHPATEFFARVCFLAGLVLVYAGLRHFARMRSTSRTVVTRLLLISLLLAGSSWLPEGTRLAIGVAMLSATALTLASLRALTFVRNKSFPEYFTAVVLGTLVVMYLSRLAQVVGGLDTDVLQSKAGDVQKAYFFATAISLGSLMLGLLMIASKRLRDTLIIASIYHELDVTEREQRWALGEDLQMAIDRDELTVCYQPRVDVQTGHVVALEALLRWSHPTLGAISPDRFIPIAEETGSIDRIGQWVMQQGVACAALVTSMYPEMKMSINVSAMQIVSPDFVELVREVLNKAGVAPSVIELELTESVVIDDPAHATATLTGLRALGVTLSIDDFGTGYSSLSYLKRLPVSCVKIDRSFVHDIPDNEDATTLTRAIIAMGHALKLRIVAEGVETQEQLDLLREAGVQEYQGFLFSHPLTESEAFKLLARQSLAPPGVHRIGLVAAPH